MYCGREGNGKNSAGAQKINEAEILDELEADDLGLDVAVEDVGDDEEVGEDAHEDDEADEQHLDVVRHKVDGRRILRGDEVWGT